jgi:GDPmannose 4,6-dehydratase
MLGWKAKTKFEELVKLMIKSDMDKVLKRGF